jgi:DegV family protein with EDD domain
MSVAIVCDSTCDLSAKEAQSLGIDLVPITVKFGDTSYLDGVDLTLDEFYAKLAAARDLPTTVPPTPEAFAAAFKRRVDAGQDVVCLVVSEKLSKTYASAVQGAAAFGDKVRVVNSKTLTGGIGLIATAAAKMARDGKDSAAIRTALDRWIANQRLLSVYPDLKHLERSGRINKAQLVLGTVMHLTPIMRLGKDGGIEGETTARSFDKAKELIVDIALRHIVNPSKARIAIVHSHAPELAQYIYGEMQKRLPAPPLEMLIREAGPTIAANAGPGAVSIATTED